MSRFKLPNYVYSNEHLLGILMELKDTSSAKWVGEKTELITLKPQQSLILTTDETVIQSNQSQHVKNEIKNNIIIVWWKIWTKNFTT